MQREREREGLLKFSNFSRQLETLGVCLRVPQIHTNPYTKDQHCPASISICSTYQPWTSTSSLGCWQGEPGNRRWRRLQVLNRSSGNDIPKGGNGKLTWEGSRCWESLIYIIPRSRKFWFHVLPVASHGFTWKLARDCHTRAHWHYRPPRALRSPQALRPPQPPRPPQLQPPQAQLQPPRLQPNFLVSWLRHVNSDFFWVWPIWPPSSRSWGMVHVAFTQVGVWFGNDLQWILQMSSFINYLTMFLPRRGAVPTAGI